MNKIVAVGLFVLIVGAVPVYAADSANAPLLQSLSPSAYEEIMNTRAQIQNMNPALSQNLNNLKDEFMKNPQINEFLQNTNVQDQIGSVLQSKDVRTQIHSLIQNKEVQDGINNLMQNKDVQNGANTLIQNSAIKTEVNEILNHLNLKIFFIFQEVLKSLLKGAT